MANKTFEVALLLTAADKATRVINDVTTNATKRMQRMSDLSSRAFSFGRGAGAVGLGLTAVLAGPLKAAADMEAMNISLQSSFKGNVEAARNSYNELNKFSAANGLINEEVTTSFLKLKNQGLDPSTKALEAYGNIAASMPGKKINDFTEAVLDAVVNENERLKEFGIKAKTSGDFVDYTFQEMTTRVKNNSREIQQYFQYIGNVKFAGALKNQSESINGMMAKLRNGVMMTAAKIGTVFLPRLKEIMTQITPVIDKVSAWVEKNPKLTETILKIVAGAALLSFTVAGLAFAFGGVFKVIQGGIFIFNAYKTTMLAVTAFQNAFTFSLLASSSGWTAFIAGLKATNLAFLTSPIFLVALVIAGVVFLIIKYWKPLGAFFSSMWAGIKSIFWKAVDFMKEWGVLFLGPIGWVIKAYQLLPDNFKQIGTDIVMGLWNGIKAKATQLFDFVKSIGKGISTAFKNVLGIASPSKVFMDYGVNITEGAHNGIKKGQSKLVGASSGMGKSIVPTSGKGGGSSSSAITVNFSPVINGGSGDVASQVRALIPELIRQIESKMQRKARLAY